MEFLNKNLSFKYNGPYAGRTCGGEFLLASVQDKEYNIDSVKKLLLGYRAGALILLIEVRYFDSRFSEVESNITDCYFCKSILSSVF